MNADDIEQALNSGGSEAYFMTRNAARAHASLLRSIETGEMRERIMKIIHRSADDYGYTSSGWSADSIIALFREGGDRHEPTK